MECSQCYSKNVINYGKYNTYQKYKCKNCNRQFSERSLRFFHRHRFPEEVITNSVLQSFFLSTRNVAFIIKETMGFTFTNMTAYNWAKKFIHKNKYYLLLNNGIESLNSKINS